jgi:hypothetical protein
VSIKGGDELVEQIRTGNDSSGEAANQLLSRFHHGYPVRNISRLVRSEDDEVVKAGAWLVSELGASASSILDEIEYLLAHPLRNARYYAVEAVLAAASGDHGALIAKALMLIADSDSAVRKLAVRLLARASAEQLAGAIPYVTDRHVADLTSWLLNEGSDLTRMRDVMSRLSDPDKAIRMFAAASAARLAIRDQRALDRATESDDPDVRDFAMRERDLLRWRRT